VSYRWLNSGASKDSGDEDTLYGLNMLVFRSDGKISHAISFRQPTKGESHKLLKDTVKKMGA
jgi:hypothetical protein